MTDVKDVAWDLEPLVDGRGPSGVDDLLDDAQRRADALGGERGKVGSFDGPKLEEFMRELGAIEELSGRAASYAGLLFSTDTSDPERGALLQKVEERTTAISTRLLFFELEWAALDDAAVDEILSLEGLNFCRHYLRTVRRYRDYLLTEPEERILKEKAVTGRSAWSRLFDEITSVIDIEVDGTRLPLAEGLSRLHSPVREVRRTTAEAVTAALAPGVRTRAYLFNTLLADKATDDRLRGYEHWLKARNLSNEVSDDSVKALIEAAMNRYDLPQRWYALKAKLLGLDRLADYDRAAPLTEDDEEVAWDDARTLVLDAYTEFSTDLAQVAERFFDEAWIDAPVRPGKRNGAFCSYTVPSLHPYILLNYTARRRDVLTLAHELGHGCHAYLARPQGVFHFSTPLTLAETASVFGETLVFSKLMSQITDDKARLALLAERLEDAIATVFRQTAMNRFEDAVHTTRRKVGELSVDRFNELWTSTQTDMLGDAVEITDGYRIWWSYIPHFIGSPGYVYAYAYGQLFALSVYRRYEERGSDFVGSYLELLSAGGSMSPEELGAIVDCDVSDPGFWDGGLRLIEEDLTAAEELARSRSAVS